MSAPNLAMPSQRQPVSVYHAANAAPALAGYSLQAALAAARGRPRGAILFPRLIVTAEGQWFLQPAPGATPQPIEARNG